MCSVLRLQAPASSTHEAFERYRSSAGQGTQIHRLCSSRVHRRQARAQEEGVAVRGGRRGFSRKSSTTSTPRRSSMRFGSASEPQNTALGNGIALPHATIATAAKTYLGVFTTATPMDYGAHDGIGVDVFFVTLGTPGDRNEHLVLLGSIARLVKGTGSSGSTSPCVVVRGHSERAARVQRRN